MKFLQVFEIPCQKDLWEGCPASLLPALERGLCPSPSQLCLLIDKVYLRYNLIPNTRLLLEKTEDV